MQSMQQYTLYYQTHKFFDNVTKILQLKVREHDLDANAMLTKQSIW